MSLKDSILGLNEFLSDVYRTPMRLSLVLEAVGLTSAEIATIQVESLPLFVEEVVETIARRTQGWSGGEMAKIILVRGFGLDGQPVLTVEALGRQFGAPTQVVADLALKTLNQWRRKPTRALLEQSIRQIARGLLDNPEYGRDIETIREHLAELVQRQQAHQALQDQLQSQKDGLMAPLQPALEALEGQARPALSEMAREISNLCEAICGEVLTLGASVHSDALLVEYRDGRVAWDDEALRNYAATHPEILQYRRVGQPTVSLRQSKEDGTIAAPLADGAEAGD